MKLLILCLLAGCASGQPQSLKPLIEEFSRLTKRDVKDIDIWFGSPGTLPGWELPKDEASVVASCYGYIKPLAQQIVIDPKKWVKLDNLAKAVVLWHELYHCEFESYGHVSEGEVMDCNEYTIPYLMSESHDPSSFTAEHLECYRNWLIKEGE